MAIESKIRWKKGDYITLGKAVAEFNKKIKRLEQEEADVILPDTASYQDIKKKIYSRKELNRIVNSLKRFQKEGAEDIYISSANEPITKWEMQETRKQARIAKRKIQEELTELYQPTESGFSYAQMGISRVRELERTLEKIEKVETSTNKEDIQKARKLVKAIGTLDYDTKKAITYRENYIEMIEKTYSNYKNYKKFKEKLDSLQDPKAFWNFLKTNEKLRDITYMYDLDHEGIAGTTSEKAFDELLESIGIELDKREIKKAKTGKYKVSNNNTYKIR